MNFSLKSHPLIAHWVPGFSTIVLALAARSNWRLGTVLNGICTPSISIAVLVGAFVLGDFLDVIRDLTERILDKRRKIDWKFFFKGEKTHLENLENYYFTYYVFTANMVIGIVLVFAYRVGRSFIIQYGWQAAWARPAALLVVLGAFGWNAWTLRDEIHELIPGKIKEDAKNHKPTS